MGQQRPRGGGGGVLSPWGGWATLGVVQGEPSPPAPPHPVGQLKGPLGSELCGHLSPGPPSNLCHRLPGAGVDVGESWGRGEAEKTVPSKSGGGDPAGPFRVPAAHSGVCARVQGRAPMTPGLIRVSATWWDRSVSSVPHPQTVRVQPPSLTCLVFSGKLAWAPRTGGLSHQDEGLGGRQPPHLD